ncbi:ABC transporter ATP-binding protein [Streptomyces millisiae]|uniref:ABC transporter ATP-binding protein n=1 Tax=Streptomyces millisiae TaxID=3075542 RepID=A0ABU2LWA1_9ACTN|nr:ABC transporter ATP-binding protein [Streptomyces sp. DSM 44918]MDT0321876.1 ABC transporter ATP-binding protein [Streptomyces sp. DSM 44918]
MTHSDSSSSGTTTPQGPTSHNETLRYIPSGSGVFERNQVTTGMMIRRLPHLLRQALGLGWRIDRRAVTLLLACQAAAGFLEAFGLVAITGVLGALIGDGNVAAEDIDDRLRDALPSLAVLAAAFGARAALGITVTNISTRLAPRMTREAQLELLRAATRAELSAYDNPGFSEQQEAANRGAEASRDLLIEAQDVMASIASLVAAAGVMTVLHPVLLPLLALATLPQGWASIRGVRVHYEASRATAAHRVASNHLRWHILTKQAADQIRASTMADYLLGRYRTIGARIDEQIDKAAHSEARYALTGAVAGGIATAGVWAALLGLLASGRMSLAAAGTAVVALRTVSTSLHGLVGYGTRLFRSGLYLDDWSRFIAAAASHRIKRGTISPPSPDVVRAESVTYQYPGADKPALDAVSVEVHRGEILALVGENGSGKTTLSRLLAGLYLPTAGEVTWDNISTLALDPEAAWAHTALIPQNFTRWPMTARANITLGQPLPGGDASVLEAAEHSGAAEVIAEQRSGLDTLLANHEFGGVELSGGQWQRVAIARAFYRPAGLLVMDEPTSALDARAEHRIFAGLRDYAKNRCVVLVTHRLTNVAIADRIVVLDHGRVIQSGGFEELRAAPGLFRELWQLQSDLESSAPKTTPTGLPQQNSRPAEPETTPPS